MGDRCGQAQMNYNTKIVLAFWRDCVLPAAQTEFQFHPSRKWRFDFAFAVPRLAIEVQGGIWTRGRHSRGSGLVKEYEKLNAAAVLGWRILYCTPQQVQTLQFARTIKAALATDETRIEH